MVFLFTLLALLFLPLNLYVYASHWLVAKHVVEDVIAYPSIIFTFLLMMVPMGIGVLVAKLRPRVAQAMNKVSDKNAVRRCMEYLYSVACVSPITKK